MDYSIIILNTATMNSVIKLSSYYEITKDEVRFGREMAFFVLRIQNENTAV